MVASACKGHSRIPLVPEVEFKRRKRRTQSDDADLWNLLDAVCDPEIPALSLWDLGVLQDIKRGDGGVVVTITPTYSGCPAMSVMAEDIEAALLAGGQQFVRVETRLSPAWTTDWLSADAREQLRQYGIAPPGETETREVHCPRCSSAETHLISEFGSTACKALYQCDACAEPFDYFKSI